MACIAHACTSTALLLTTHIPLCLPNVTSIGLALVHCWGHACVLYYSDKNYNHFEGSVFVLIWT